MWPSLQPSPRPSLRFIAQLGAGLLVPMWVAPAMAQGVAVITPSPAMAPRDEREKLAPAVMAPAAAEAMRAEQTANQLAWRESLKRMKADETDEPNRALAAYKRFFNERTMSPELGVEVGVKIAQLRFKLGDSKDALQTCEVLAAKYADEPTAVLLSLQKARVLMESKQLAQASQCVNGVMPSLVALGPSRYREISDLLLKLVQANLDNGDDESKEWARTLCVGVEEIYLRWAKKDTIDHLWQRFQALKVEYKQAGDYQRAEELLIKVGDMVLQFPPRSSNVEQAVLAFEMAQWLSYQDQSENSAIESEADRQTQAMRFYAQVAQSPDNYHASGAVIEGFGRELQLNPKQAEIQLLKIENDVPSADARLAAQFLIAKARYKARDWGGFLERAKQALSNYDQSQKSRRSWFFDLAVEMKELEKWAKLWQKQDLVIENSDLQIVLASSLQQPLERRIFVNSAGSSELKATVEGDAKRVDVRVEPSPWSSDLEEVRHQQIVVVTITPGVAEVRAIVHIEKATEHSTANSLKVEVTRFNAVNVATKGET